MSRSSRTRPSSANREFLTSEASGGVLLIAAAILAMIVANTGFYDLYHHALHVPVGPMLTPKLGPMSAHLWINDGLMAIFFLLVGLEIKREFLDGRLSTWEKRRLPVMAAACGMAIPALVYLAISGGDPALSRGWAVPAATDIAFAIGVLALLGPRAPASLKLFLTAVAIVDDMGAVAIIALAYTASINTLAIGAAAAIWLVMYMMGKGGVRALWPFLIGAALLWYAVLLSGVHATIAGVLAATTIPIRVTPGAPDATDSPLHRLEHALHPWTAFLIVPLFGFANAGVSLQGLGMDAVFGTLPLAVAGGLVIGKQAGIFGIVWLSVRLGWSKTLKGATWLQIYGVSLLCGIGFTMSLFIGALAFAGQPLLIEEAKIGILLGSIVSAIAGYLVLRLAPAEAGATNMAGMDAERAEELRP